MFIFHRIHFAFLGNVKKPKNEIIMLTLIGLLDSLENLLLTCLYINDHF